MAQNNQKKKNSKARPPRPEGAKNIQPMLPPEVKIGRPCEYVEDYADQAAYLCSLGATDNELARWFNCDYHTIRDWAFKFPAFSSALKAGKSAADDRVERSLYMNAVGYTYEIEKAVVVKDAAGGERLDKITLVERMNPNTVAQIFWLKNRRKEIWRDVHQMEHGGVGDFDKLSDLQLAERMAKSAEDLAKLQKALPAPKKNGNGSMHGNGGMN